MFQFWKLTAIVVILFFLSLASFLSVRGFIKGNQAVGETAPNPTPKLVDGKVTYPQDFTIVLVGDSMTEAFGNSTELRANLKEYYPNKSFEVLNYGFGSTNILTIPDRLEKTTFYTRDFRPITDIDFDLIVIESFGHNPLSQFPLEEGLKKQNETLDKIVSILKAKNPQAKIVFMTTISPSKVLYATGTVELSREKRLEWATERIAYIKNHIDYANKNNIPLVNAYEKSLIEGDLNIDLVNDKDFIHPSPTGVIFLSKILADEIYNQKLLD